MKYNFFDKKNILFLLTVFAIMMFLFVLLKSYRVAQTSSNLDALPVIKSEEKMIKVKAEDSRLDGIEQNSFYNGLSGKEEGVNIKFLESNTTDTNENILELEDKIGGLGIDGKNVTPDEQNSNIKGSLSDNNYSNAENTTNSYKVQLIALKNREQAVDYINLTKKSYGELLRDLDIFIVEIDLKEKGIFYRVQIGNFLTKLDANNFCSIYLKKSNKNLTNCIVVR